jgi:2,3-bisphosphoglycerate-dependent phosphoglycerate mutase
VTAPRAHRQARFQAPPGAAELILVRHGESEPAVEGRPFPLVGGHGDPALAPEGRTQADLVCRRLALEGVDAIYVTSLRRTAQTAEPLARHLGLEPTVEPDLREVHLGEWEGGELRRRVADGDPIVAKMWDEQRWDVIPGAEPANEFRARVRGAIERIAAGHADQRVAVFAHGGTIGEVLAQATEARPFAFTGADNGSISHLVVTDDRWVVRRFNDTSHLDGAFTTGPDPLT